MIRSARFTGQRIRIGAYSFGVACALSCTASPAADRTATSPAGAAGTQSDVRVEIVQTTPGPVRADEDIVTVAEIHNEGPVDAPAPTFDVLADGKLEFRSIEAPEGVACEPAAAGGTSVVSCTAQEPLPPGGSLRFTITWRPDPVTIGNRDASLAATYSAASTNPDPDSTNNSVTVTTGYVAARADLSLGVVDSPDPAFVGDLIDFVVTLRNGVEIAPNVVLDFSGDGKLRFVEITLDPDSGFTCTSPAVGGVPTFACTNPSVAGNATAQFVLTLLGASSTLGAGGGVAATSFSVSSGKVDSNAADNSETELTSLRADDVLFRSGFEQ